MSICDILPVAENDNTYKNLFNRLTDGDWSRDEYDISILEPTLLKKYSYKDYLYEPNPIQKYSYNVLKYTKNKKGIPTLCLSKEILPLIKPPNLAKKPREPSTKLNKYVKKRTHFHFNPTQKKILMAQPFPKNNLEYFILCNKLHKTECDGRIITKKNIWRFVKGQKYQHKLKNKISTRKSY
jgi:hypothetical protein